MFGAMKLESLGVFAFMDGMNGKDTAHLARFVEELGYSALWCPEWAGRDAFAHAPFLLSATTSLVIATGIAKRVRAGRIRCCFGSLDHRRAVRWPLYPRAWSWPSMQQSAMGMLV